MDLLAGVVVAVLVVAVLAGRRRLDAAALVAHALSLAGSLVARLPADLAALLIFQAPALPPMVAGGFRLPSTGLRTEIVDNFSAALVRACLAGRFCRVMAPFSGAGRCVAVPKWVKTACSAFKRFRPWHQAEFIAPILLRYD